MDAPAVIVGWHYLPHGGEDPQPPMGAATFLDLEPTLGMRSPERLCRPYFKGRPDPRELAQKAAAWHAQGCRVQIANEPNHPIEQFGGTPIEYLEFFGSVRAVAPTARLYWAGMSPGFTFWQAWYAPARASGAVGVATHAYGTLDQMRSTVEEVRRLTGLPQWIAECNYGAGQEVDRDAWALDHLAPFLEWCSQQPDVEAVTYFAHSWSDPDMPLPTPVDGAGTEIERALRAFKGVYSPEKPPVVPGGPLDTFDALTMPKRRSTAHPENYSPVRRSRTLGVVVHSTAGTSSSLAREFIATINWFQSSDAGVSAHAIVGPTEVCVSVPEDQTAWHCRALNASHLGLEIAWPDTPGYAVTPYPAAVYEHAGEVVARWAKKYGFPLAWSPSDAQPGLRLHKETAPGQGDGRRDPTGPFDKVAFLAACTRWAAKIGGQPPPVDAVTDALNGISHHLNAAEYAARQVLGAVALARGELEELKRAVGR